jgi:hypothetical protein
VSGLRVTARDGDSEVRLRDPRPKKKPWVCETRRDPARRKKKSERRGCRQKEEKIGGRRRNKKKKKI